VVVVFYQFKTDLHLPESNPVQVLLCVIVLLDAGIVIAQILLDLNSVKGNFRYRRRSSCRTDHILIEIGAQFQ